MQEDYKTWPIRKFHRLLPQWMEAEHMAPNQTTYRAYHIMLIPAAAAFKELHPRAYAHWQQQMTEKYGFTYK